MTAPLLELRDDRLAFGDQQIYAGLDLTVQRGETLTILGASGSGKSVLLKLIMGLHHADSGSMVFDGKHLESLEEEAWLPIRRRIAMLFQGAALFDSLSVAENIAYPLRIYGELSDAAIAERVAETLEVVGLPDTRDMYPAELSGGMKKRVALARAIAPKPDLILYDEPTTGLDPMNTRRIVELIRSIQASLHATSIVVTHDLVSAFMVSDRIAMLHDHRILSVLPAAEFRSALVPAIQEFVSAMPVAQ
jgi:phospholipid/cholesterol/gamma-HCH transport system ATP-binding protein